MVKVFVPHPTSHRGSPIAVAQDRSADVTFEALAELRSHGVREWTADDEIGADKASGTDPTNMSRKELLDVVKGKGAGNVTLRSNDQLRALATKVLAGGSIALL
jgi:hypothetical protein